MRVLLSSIVLGFHQQLPFISACILFGNMVTCRLNCLLIMQRYCALAQINIEQSQRIMSLHTVYLNLFVIMKQKILHHFCECKGYDWRPDCITFTHAPHGCRVRSKGRYAEEKVLFPSMHLIRASDRAFDNMAVQA